VDLLDRLKKIKIRHSRFDQKRIRMRADLEGGYLMENLQARIEVIGFENPEFGQLLKLALARQGVSVTSLQVTALSAPMTGDHMMQATVLAFLPPDCSLRIAEHAIEEISDDLSVVAQAA
jgi:glycine cleavage system regulatory protein